MNVLLSKDGPRGSIEPTVGVVARLRAFGAKGCNAVVATAVIPTGAWL